MSICRLTDGTAESFTYNALGQWRRMPMARAILQETPALPKTGWVFVDKATTLESASAIRVAQFYIAENELEEIELERSKRTLVECPMLADIISVLDNRSISPSADDYLAALIYYHENDDFKE